MKLLRCHAVLLVLTATAVLPAVAASAKAHKQSVPNPLAPRFQQVRERIGALFEHRNGLPAPRDAAHNPFRVPGVAGASATPDNPTAVVTAPPEPMTDLALLQQAAASLKVSGVFEIGGRSHLVINARPYKLGDVVQTLVQGEKVYLRVKEISKRSVTLTLNEAELTLSF